MRKDKISRNLDTNIRINISNTTFKEVDRFFWKGKTDGNIKRIPKSPKLHEIMKGILQNIQISKQCRTISCKVYLNQVHPAMLKY